MPHPRALAFVLAGGKGERLFPLTSFRSKPSVPFGGRYRIVDFVLSNMINSRIYSIYLLVQYKSQSLIEHIRQNWVLSAFIKDHFVTVVPPQMHMGPEWFQGTADAVFQNINLIRQHNPGLVIGFGADHIYRMDVRQMINFHLEKDASVTVAARPAPLEQASAFGVILTDSEKRIIGFQEKPKNPTPIPDEPSRAYVSMGNYIFNTGVLLDALSKAQRKKQHDFGAHVIPALVDTKRVFAYNFETVIHGAKIRNSIIRSGVVIENDVTVEDCVIMDHAVLRKGCSLRKVIVDKLNVVNEGEQIGFDPDTDRFRCHIDSSGIAIIPRGGRLKKT